MALGLWCHPSKTRYFQWLSLPQWDHHPVAHQCIGSHASTQTPPILACVPKSGRVRGVLSAPARGERCTAALATGAQPSPHVPWIQPAKQWLAKGNAMGDFPWPFYIILPCPPAQTSLHCCSLKPSSSPLLHLLKQREQVTPKSHSAGLTAILCSSHLPHNIASFSWIITTPFLPPTS